MRLLLDTHAVLWFASGDAALSTKARAQMLDSTNEVLVSHVTLWELAIKSGLGKLTLDRALSLWLEKYVTGNGFTYLAIAQDHILRTSTLPRHHGDPFDRLLAAQCELEQLMLISRDLVFDSYHIRRLW